LEDVDVVNINDLAAAMKPTILPGEKMKVRIVRGGEEPGQGVGFLDDGTMVVVEQARQLLNDEVEITVSRALQTSAGRMIFGKVGPK
ncbi:MAG TPA: TRAM domain-containing protein, partial [Humisphaera sp.]|nr:TRAM domain-containing protein [Humisphaera sp.]